MPLLTIESEALTRVKNLVTNQLGPQVRRRIQVVLAATQAGTVTEVARMTGASRPHVRRALNSFRAGGIDAVLAVKPGRGRRSGATEVEAAAKELLSQANPAKGRWKLKHLSKAIGISAGTVSRVRQRSNLAIPRYRQTPTPHEDRAENQLIVGLFLDPPLRVLVLHPGGADVEQAGELNETRNLKVRAELARRIARMEKLLRSLPHKVSCAAKLARLLRASAGESRRLALFAQGSSHPEVQKVIAAYDQATRLTPSTDTLDDWLGKCVARAAPAVASTVRMTVEYGALSRFLDTEAQRIQQGKITCRPWLWFVGHRSSYQPPDLPSGSASVPTNLDLPPSVAPVAAVDDDVPF